MLSIISKKKNSQGKLRNTFKLNKKKSATQNLWDITRGILRKKCIALNTYIGKEERPK